MSARENEAGRPGPAMAERLAHALEVINDIAAIDSSYCAVLHDAQELSLPEMENEFRLYGEKVLDMIAALFSTYTGDKCAACIKALNLTEDVPNTANLAAKYRKGELPFVYTFWRDRGSRRRRKTVDADPALSVYPHDRNTGLSWARQVGYWHCNDLRELGSEYSNKNGKWNSYYNATAIACIASPSEGKPANPLGFLCIDNMKGGFDGRSCKHIMMILSNLLYYSMWMTTLISTTKGDYHER